MAESREERIARNEASFRSLNESLSKGVHDRLAESGTDLAGFVCECGDPECTATVRVDLERYEEIRQDPRLFLILPGHEIPDVEDVVQRTEGFLVVHKHEEVTDIVRDTDPRS